MGGEYALPTNHDKGHMIIAQEKLCGLSGQQVDGDKYVCFTSLASPLSNTKNNNNLFIYIFKNKQTKDLFKVSYKLRRSPGGGGMERSPHQWDGDVP